MKINPLSIIISELEMDPMDKEQREKIKSAKDCFYADNLNMMYANQAFSYFEQCLLKYNKNKPFNGLIVNIIINFTEVVVCTVCHNINKSENNFSFLKACTDPDTVDFFVKKFVEMGYGKPKIEVSEYNNHAINLTFKRSNFLPFQ